MKLPQTGSVVVVAVIVMIALIVGGGVIIGLLKRSGGDHSSSTVAMAFQQELIRRGIERGGQPIEGFNADLLLRAFPGLHESDFDGVETREGIYAYTDGNLRFERTQSQPITSAEEQIASEGYATLLDNLSRRLNLTIPHAEAAVDLVNLLTTETNSSTNGQTACTSEAKICPDGSTVSRVGPNCEFAACPGEQ